MRAILAAPMKTGSTYISRVLADYFGVTDYKPFLYGGWQDHLLQIEIILRAPADFILQCHLKASRMNLGLITQYDLPVVLLWRNLGDVLISLADHVRKEWNEMPVCYVPDRAAFCAMSAEDQYSFLIHAAMPWYLAFRRQWRPHVRLHGGAFHQYETMLASPHEFFVAIIRQLDPYSPLRHDHLNAVLERVAGAPTRKNVGIAGRSAHLLTNRHKQEIERLILLYHPDEQSALVGELPWNAGPSGAPPTAECTGGLHSTRLSIDFGNVSSE